MQEFFYNELSFAVYWHDIADEVLDGFNENLLDMVGAKIFVKEYRAEETNGHAMYVVEEEKYPIAVDIFNHVRAKGLEKSQLSWMIASMKSYMLINKKLNPTLDAIDALCGCPFLLSNECDEEEFKLLTAAEKEDVCAELFHTLNFMREIINIFSQQSDPKIQGKIIFMYLRALTHWLECVIKRLEQAVDVERRLDMYLSLMPNFVPGTKPKAKPKSKSSIKSEKSAEGDDMCVSIRITVIGY